jgi:hypothetical protein
MRMPKFTAEYSLYLPSLDDHTVRILRSQGGHQQAVPQQLGVIGGRGLCGLLCSDEGGDPTLCNLLCRRPGGPLLY